MQEFSAKRDALFACLDDASKELKGTALDQSNSKSYPISSLGHGHNTRQVMLYRHDRDVQIGSDSDEDCKLKRMRGKESIFKKPELPIGRCLKPRKTPDYQINPHKWKKYSLSDVDISEQTNSAAALSFLREMDAQREAKPYEDNDCEITCKKIEFKKTSKLNRNLKKLTEDEVNDEELDRPQLRGSKLVMPEYIVGQKSQSRKKKPPKKIQNRAAGSLSLSHLDEADEIDE